jgi:hypothetical protein
MQKVEATLDVTGAGKGKRGRGGSVPSPKERRTLWEASLTSSSYLPPQSIPPQVPSVNRVFACEYPVKRCRHCGARAAGRRNGGNPLAKWRNPSFWDGRSSCPKPCRTTPQNGIQSKPDSALRFRSTDSPRPLSPLARGRRAGPMRNGSPVRREDAGLPPPPARVLQERG